MGVGREREDERREKGEEKKNGKRRGEGGRIRDLKDSLFGRRKKRSFKRSHIVVKSTWPSSDMMTMKLTISPALIATKII